MTYHPAGHCIATASHDGILKFWGREPAGSTLEPDQNKEFQDNPVSAFGPLPLNAPNIIPITSAPPPGTTGGPMGQSERGGNQQQYQNHGGGDRGGIFSYNKINFIGVAAKSY